MVGGDMVAGAFEAARVMADDVVAQTTRPAEAGGDRQVVRGGEFDRFLTADDRHPDRRAWLLQWPRPKGGVIVAPIPAFIRKHLFTPRPGDDVERFFKAGARVGKRYVVNLVFARNAA